MSDLQDQLDQKGSRIELLEKQLMSAVCLPILSMSDFSQHKEMNDEWFSAPVYTHPRGYKFCIQVRTLVYSLAYLCVTNEELFLI